VARRKRRKPTIPSKWRAPPRRIDRTSLISAGLVFIVGGLFLLVPGCISHVEDSRFLSEGVVVQGMVTDKRGRKGQTEVDYRFVTADKRVVDGTDRMGVRDWTPLQIGGPVTVTYLPSRPESNRTVPRDDRSGDVVFGLSIVGAGLVFLAMAAFRWPA
jgi:hypothetical protein